MKNAAYLSNSMDVSYGNELGISSSDGAGPPMEITAASTAIVCASPLYDICDDSTLGFIVMNEA